MSTVRPVTVHSPVWCFDLASLWIPDIISPRQSWTSIAAPFLILQSIQLGTFGYTLVL